MIFLNNFIHVIIFNCLNLKFKHLNHFIKFIIHFNIIHFFKPTLKFPYPFTIIILLTLLSNLLNFTFIISFHVQKFLINYIIPIII